MAEITPTEARQLIVETITRLRAVHADLLAALEGLWGQDKDGDLIWPIRIRGLPAMDKSPEDAIAEFCTLFTLILEQRFDTIVRLAGVRISVEPVARAAIAAVRGTA